MQYKSILGPQDCLVQRTSQPKPIHGNKEHQAAPPHTPPPLQSRPCTRAVFIQQRSYHQWHCRKMHVATCAEGQEKARPEPSKLRGQWYRNQPNSVVVTKPWARQGTDATATAKTALLDLTANRTLPVLLPPKLVPRFSGLSASIRFTQQIFIECLLYARHCPRHLISSVRKWKPRSLPWG